MNKLAPKERWKIAISKFKHVLIPEYYIPNKSLMDCVRVNIAMSKEKEESYGPYFEEIARATQTKDTPNGLITYKMLRMGDQQLEKSKLYYDNVLGILLNAEKKIATTLGKESKDKENTQVFVLSKEGNLYVNTQKDEFDEEGLNPTHASFLSGRPAELAGMVRINENGKIDWISSESGHYAPGPLDMYRGIKSLNKSMPHVFAENAEVECYHSDLDLMFVNQFIEMMEAPGISGKPVHHELRAQRILEKEHYKASLKNAEVIKLNSNASGLSEAILNITKEKEKEIIEKLRKPLISISVKERGERSTAYNIQELLEEVIKEGNKEAMQKLLDCGIAKKQEFFLEKPWLKAMQLGNKKFLQKQLDNEATQNKKSHFYLEESSVDAMIIAYNEITKILLEDPDVIDFLEKEISSGSSRLLLSQAAALDNVIMVNYILQRSKGSNLLLKSDECKMNSLQYAHIGSNKKVAPMLWESFYKVVKNYVDEPVDANTPNEDLYMGWGDYIMEAQAYAQDLGNETAAKWNSLIEAIRGFHPLLLPSQEAMDLISENLKKSTEMLLAAPWIDKAFKEKISSGNSTLLSDAANSDNVVMVNYILEHPKGSNLLLKSDRCKMNSLQYAPIDSNKKVASLLWDAFYKVVKNYVDKPVDANTPNNDRLNGSFWGPYIMKAQAHAQDLGKETAPKWTSLIKAIRDSRPHILESEEAVINVINPLYLEPNKRDVIGVESSIINEEIVAITGSITLDFDE